MRVRLLLISSNTTLRESAKREARGFPLFFDAVPTPQHGERLFADSSAQGPQVVLIDPPDDDHARITDWARRTFPDLRALFLLPTFGSGTPGALTAAFDPDTWLAGAEIVIVGPQDRAGLQKLMRRLVEGAAAAGDRAGARGLDELIGRSVRFREALDLALKAAGDPRQPVLLVGEKGTGKRLFARVIHAETSETRGSLLRFDCRAHTTRALERALRGEMPMAGRSGEGEGYSGPPSTLFLEEITALGASGQEKVLTFLKEVRRDGQFGGGRPARPRLIAATAKKPDAAVRSDMMSADLLSSLRECLITLPSLRERPSDILLLAERFMKRRAQDTQAQVPQLSREVQERLLSHPWPGNIRELFGVLEAAIEASVGQSEITLAHLPEWLTIPLSPESDRLGKGDRTSVESAESHGGTRVAASEGGVVVELPDQGVSFEEIEKAILTVALAKTGNNVVRAARLLRLGRGSLRYRLEKYGIVEPRRRRSAKRRHPPADSPEAQQVLRRAS